MADLKQNHPAQRHSSPNAIPWPPLIIVGAVAAGWLLNKVLPSLAGLSMIGYYPLGQTQTWLGWLLIGAALLMDVWVLTIFRRHNTNIRPDRPATTLVDTGPFKYSRNPIYVGNVAIVLGLALTHGSLWYAMLVPITLTLIQELAIKREEVHMAARFGEAWHHYAASTRRWL